MRRIIFMIIFLSLGITVLPGCNKKSASPTEVKHAEEKVSEQNTVEQQGNDSNSVNSDRKDWIHFRYSFTKFDGEHQMRDEINQNRFNELIKGGANINVRNDNGQSLLMVTNEPDVMKALIDAGIDVNIKDDSGMTALINLGGMRYVHNPECVDLLIKAGANVNEKDDFGRTALMHIPPINIYEKNYGRSSLASVIPLTEEELTESDIDWGADFDAKFINEYTKKLIEAGANVNEKDSDGRTPLMYAVFPESVRALIDAGADVKATDNDGNTALMYTIFPESVKMLIDAGTDVNAKNNKGETALMHAYFAESVKNLVKAGADVNAKNNEGKTALMFAERVDTLEALIAAGADVKAKDNMGYSAFMYAYARQFRFDLYDGADPKKVVQMFKTAGADIHTKDNHNNSLVKLIKDVCDFNLIRCEKSCYEQNDLDEDEENSDAYIPNIDICLMNCCVNFNDSEANVFIMCGNKCMSICDDVGDCGWRCDPNCLDSCDNKPLNACTKECKKYRNGFEEIIDFDELCDDEEVFSQFVEYLDESKVKVKKPKKQSKSKK